MALDTITLKCFLSVVETGNITKTAHLIGRTQSAVSQQLARLEALLGKNLFNRENGFKLNHDGEIFYLYAKKIYQVQLESINRLNNTDSEGEIKIGLPEDFASKVLIDTLSHFSHMYPRVNLNIECDLTTIILERFQRDEFDLCVIKELTTENIPQNVLAFQDELVWVGSIDTMKRLRKESVVPLILSPKESIYRDLVLKTLDSANIKWRVVFNSRSYANKTLAAIAGLGVTVVQKSLIPTDNNLVTIPNLPALGMINLCILQNKNSAAIKYLVKLLVKIITGTN